MKRRASLLLWLTLCCSVNAQFFNPPIKGPDRVEAHEPITLECGVVIPADGSAIVDWSSVPTGLQFLPADVDKWKAVHAWGKEGTYQIIATATIADWEARKLTKQVFRGKLTIGKPEPTPEPDPPPKPPVPIPPSKFGLTKVALEAVAAMPRSDLDKMVKVKMPDGNVVEVRAIDAIAANYNEVAAMISDKTIIDIQSAIDRIKARNHEILSGGAGAWPDKFFAPLGKSLNELWIGGTIKNLDDWAVAFNEIYTGLRALPKGR